MSSPQDDEHFDLDEVIAEAQRSLMGNQAAQQQRVAEYNGFYGPGPYGDMEPSYAVMVRGVRRDLQGASVQVLVDVNISRGEASHFLRLIADQIERDGIPNMRADNE